MLRSRSYVRKTRKGKVMKVVREHYLRKDIACGCPTCKVCDVASARLGGGAQPEESGAASYWMIDTNVALHQMDLLEDASVVDVIVPAVVRDEVKHRNTSAYNRLRQLCEDPQKKFYVFSNEFHADTYIERNPGESANDRNDRAIRVAALWYQRHLPHTSVTLLTDDRGNLQRAHHEGLKALTTLQFAQLRTETPQLLDLVARPQHEPDDDDDGAEALPRPAKRKVIYKDHLPNLELQRGMREGRFHQGTIYTNRYNPTRATVKSESVGSAILIQDHLDMNRAVDGDRVVVELLPREQWSGESHDLGTEENEEGGEGGLAPAPAEEGRGIGLHRAQMPTGRVVGIIKRNWRPYSGSLDPKSAIRHGQHTTCLFVAHNRAVPRVRVRTRQMDTLADQRIVVTIDSWSVNSRWPDGHYVRTLGNTGDKAAETEMLLVENDINTNPFTEAVYACVPPLPWDGAAAEIGVNGREDLRAELIFSVDPPGCRDIDDALHIKMLPNGNMEVGVHIADVTHFVHPGSAVDDEAADRCTSVYLVDRRIDMLPKALTEDICSLRSNVERLAFSVLWELDADYREVGVRFTKSVIKSCAAMTYQEAQTRMDDERLSDDITVACRRMNAFAKVLRQRRTDAGALTLASAEVKFKIDTETHDPMDVGMYQVREANQMVEEMMLMANVSVATHILKHYPLWSLLRRHQTPSKEMFEPLLKAAAAVGVEIEVGSSRQLADSLDKAVTADPYFNKLIRILATRCMTQAQYICTGDHAKPEYRHYGLAADLYTHFTSPIRRYADVVVHRFLAASIGIASLPHQLTDKLSVKGVADQINYRHRNAQMAGRASVELYTLIFFANKVVSTDARIVKVGENAMVVFVPKYGIEGVIKLAKKGEPGAFELDAEKQTIVSADGKRKYTIFDTTWVKISVEDTPPYGRRLVLELLPAAPKDEIIETMDTKK